MQKLMKYYHLMKLYLNSDEDTKKLYDQVEKV